MCVCVCERERGREKDRKREREGERGRERVLCKKGFDMLRSKIPPDERKNEKVK